MAFLRRLSSPMYHTAGRGTLHGSSRWMAPRCLAAVPGLSAHSSALGPSPLRVSSGMGVRWNGTDTTVDIQASAEQMFNDIIVPLNESRMGPLDRSSTQITPMPMVFVLGNHSSGKSSFINYIIGRDVQTEGLAPTDDGFTVVAPGHEDVDQDGPALIGDPDLGYVRGCCPSTHFAQDAGAIVSFSAP